MVQAINLSLDDSPPCDVLGVRLLSRPAETLVEQSLETRPLHSHTPPPRVAAAAGRPHAEASLGTHFEQGDKEQTQPLSSASQGVYHQSMVSRPRGRSSKNLPAQSKRLNTKRMTLKTTNDHPTQSTQTPNPENVHIQRFQPVAVTETRIVVLYGKSFFCWRVSSLMLRGISTLFPLGWSRLY